VAEALQCFKAYDVRGRVPDQLNEDLARRIGQAYARVVRPRKVALGHDIRLSSEALKAALADGLMSQGVDVYDIGLCGTEEIYFATSHAGMDGGIVVTASHNPRDYNGMKFVREDRGRFPAIAASSTSAISLPTGVSPQPRGAGHCRPWIRARRT
jgi:phosphomannomutase